MGFLMVGVIQFWIISVIFGFHVFMAKLVGVNISRVSALQQQDREA